MTSFTIDAAMHELRGPAGRVQVRRQVILLAAALLRAPGQVVPYAGIAAAIWPPPACPPAQPEHCIRRMTQMLRSAMAGVGARELVRTHYAGGLSIVPAAPTSVVEDQGPTLAPRGPSLTLDRVAGTLRHGGREVALGKRDAAILAALLAGDGFATTAGLLAAVYPDGKMPAGAMRVLRVKLSALRRKLQGAGLLVGIVAAHGVGYRLRAEEPAAEGS